MLERIFPLALFFLMHSLPYSAIEPDISAANRLSVVGVLHTERAFFVGVTTLIAREIP
ncbi:Uncharacterised protein [Yersinia aleksiciae]|uniref:Uncharacterized protein n=1 Tax=Yersinia aleksiciae TaxID=263819 RepID=A0A0T9TU16_YERAE|nr:Uncharacterised protein [Yersinia aleksiciae]